MWDENDLRHTAKRDFRRLAITLILQEIVLLGSAYSIQHLLISYWKDQNPAVTASELYDRLWNTGMDMIAASLLGFAVVMLLLGSRLRRRGPGERMGARQFLLALVGINGMQFLATLVTIPIERIVERAGYSLEQATEASTGTSATASMFLYSIIIAPMVEEVVFRGAVQRWLEPWGRGFALITSAALFGLMHNNLVQLPVAFACGLLFGYIAQRFSLRASIAAHAANNMIVELIGLLPDDWNIVWAVYSVAMLLCAAYLLYWCLTRSEALLRWCRGSGLPVVHWFLTSVPVLLLLTIYILRTLDSAMPA